jgi:hypothetical protein
VTKPKLEWTEKGEAEDFDAEVKFLSLLSSDTKAKAVGVTPGIYAYDWGSGDHTQS